VTPNPEIKLGSAEPLFNLEQAGLFMRSAPVPIAPPYDVHPDGQRFAMIRELDNEKTNRIVVIQNWAKEFDRQQ
jgi:hypothetical protein